MAWRGVATPELCVDLRFAASAAIDCRVLSSLLRLRLRRLVHSPSDFDVYYSGGRGRRVYRTDFRTGESTLVCMTNSEVLDMALELGEWIDMHAAEGLIMGTKSGSFRIYFFFMCAEHGVCGARHSAATVRQRGTANHRRARPTSVQSATWQARAHIRCA